MNNLIYLLNDLGEPFTKAAGSMLWQATAVILTLALLDRLLARHASAILRYGLWMLVLVKLITPPTLALPTSPAYWIVVARPENPAILQLANASTRPKPQTLASNPDRMPPPAADVPAGSSTAAYATALWLAGLLVLIGLNLRGLRVARNLVQHATAPSPALMEQFHTLRSSLHVTPRASLKLTASTHIPVVSGLRSPTVYLPHTLPHQLTAPQLKAVLCHELIHVRRGDLWIDTLQRFVQAIYWWHPLVWWANTRIREVLEEAVDEQVINSLGTDSESYPNALLAVARSLVHQPRLGLGLLGMFESKGQLKHRVERLVLMDQKPYPRSSLSIAAIVALTGSILLPLAQGNHQPTTTLNRPTILANATQATKATQTQSQSQSQSQSQLPSANPTPSIGSGAWVGDPSDLPPNTAAMADKLNRAAQLTKRITELQRSLASDRAQSLEALEQNSQALRKALPEATTSFQRLRDQLGADHPSVQKARETLTKQELELEHSTRAVALKRELEKCQAELKAVAQNIDTLSAQRFASNAKAATPLPKANPNAGVSPAPRLTPFLISTRIIRVPQNQFDKLGLGIPYKTHPDTTRIWLFARDEYNSLIKGFESRAMAKVISSPRISTTSGTPAMVSMGDTDSEGTAHAMNLSISPTMTDESIDLDLHLFQTATTKPEASNAWGVTTTNELTQTVLRLPETALAVIHSPANRFPDGTSCLLLISAKREPSTP